MTRRKARAQLGAVSGPLPKCTCENRCSNICIVGLPKKWCSLKAWLWAASTICSRTMHVPFSSAGALTPFGDLHNYHSPPPPHYPEIGELSRAMTAYTMDCTANKQENTIRDSYGLARADCCRCDRVPVGQWQLHACMHSFVHLFLRSFLDSLVRPFLDSFTALSKPPKAAHQDHKIKINSIWRCTSYALLPLHEHRVPRPYPTTLQLVTTCCCTVH